jgi:hypothetical protein
MVVWPVGYEPVSAAKFPIIGKLTGKSARNTPEFDFRARFAPHSQVVAPTFPKIGNREF